MGIIRCELIWSGIEVVITALTRNQVTGNRPWVRIPPAPLSNSLICKEFFCFQVLLYRNRNRPLSERDETERELWYDGYEKRYRCGIDRRRLVRRNTGQKRWEYKNELGQRQELFYNGWG